MISMVLTEAKMFQETPGTHSISEKTVRKNFPVRKSPTSSSLGQKKRCWCSSPKGTFFVHLTSLCPLLLHPCFLSLQWTAPCQHEPNLAGLPDRGTLPNHPWKFIAAGLQSGAAILHLMLFISQELENKLTDHYSPLPTSKLGEGTQHGQ